MDKGQKDKRIKGQKNKRTKGQKDKRTRGHKGKRTDLWSVGLHLRDVYVLVFLWKKNTELFFYEVLKKVKIHIKKKKKKKEKKDIKYCTYFIKWNFGSALLVAPTCASPPELLESSTVKGFSVVFSCPEQILKSSCPSVGPSVGRSVGRKTFVK